MNELTLNAQKVTTRWDRVYCANLYAQIRTGSMELLIPANPDYYRYDITGTKAVCVLNGETLTLPYQPEVNDNEPTGEIVIEGGNAEIHLTISE